MVRGLADMKTDTDRSPIFMRRTIGGLAPCHAHDAERLDAFATGQDLEVTIKQRRSLPQQRLYWLTLHKVVQATGDYPSAEKLHEALKMALGVVSLMKTMDGKIVAIPDSTAFANMDGAAFKDFFDRSMDAIAERYGFDPLSELIGADITRSEAA
jgi:hypothetical protein